MLPPPRGDTVPETKSLHADDIEVERFMRVPPDFSIWGDSPETTNGRLPSPSAASRCTSETTTALAGERAVAERPPSPLGDLLHPVGRDGFAAEYWLNFGWPDVSAFQPRNGFEDPLRGRVGRCGIRNKTSAGVRPREHRSRAGYFHDDRIAGSHSLLSTLRACAFPVRKSTEKFCHRLLAKPGSGAPGFSLDRKSTRLNSSHLGSSYAVFCLKQKQMG